MLMVIDLNAEGKLMNTDNVIVEQRSLCFSSDSEASLTKSRIQTKSVLFWHRRSKEKKQQKNQTTL